MAVKQTQKQRQNVNVHVNLGNKKSKRKTTRKRTARVSVLPPPIHQVYTSPIHNLMPQMFNRQGQQILTPVSPLEQFIQNIESKNNIPRSFGGRDSDYSNNSVSGSQNSITPSLVNQVEKDFSRNPIQKPARETDKDFQQAIMDSNNYQPMIDRINARRELNANPQASDNFNSMFQSAGNNTDYSSLSSSPTQSISGKRYYDEYF
jgi:hypothetical protein